MKPLLTIITINYNNKNGLKKTLDSVLSQVKVCQDDVEYIIVDGGSTDGSVELLNEYGLKTAHNLSVTKWISEKDSGIYNAMNKGIQLGNGKWVIFMNSGDMFYSENVLYHIWNILTDVNESILYGDAFCINSGSNDYVWHLPNELTFEFLYNNSICHQSTFIPLNMLKTELYDESLKIVSDWKYILIACMNGIHFKKIEEIISTVDLDGVSVRMNKLSHQECESIRNSLVPIGIRKDIEYRRSQDYKDWIYYFDSLSKNKKYYRTVFFIVRILNKIGKILSII